MNELPSNLVVCSMYAVKPFALIVSINYNIIQTPRVNSFG